MSLAEAPRDTRPTPIFGQITHEDMRGNELLTRTVLPLVRDACKHTKGRFTVDTVAQGLVSGAYRLWGVMRPPATLESIAVTTIETLPGGRVFNILMVGPEFEGMFQFLPVLQNAGRTARCQRVQITGPAFWRRRLGAGWRLSSCIYEHDLAAG